MGKVKDLIYKSETVIVKVIEKTYWYNFKEDRVELKSIHTEYIETSPREAMDLVMEINSSMTEGEELIELSSHNAKMMTCYATLT